MPDSHRVQRVQGAPDAGRPFRFPGVRQAGQAGGMGQVKRFALKSYRRVVDFRAAQVPGRSRPGRD